MSEKRLELLIENGPSANQRFTVGSGGVRLGRSSSNDIKIADEELSRNHCLFEVSGEMGVRLIDLASANGTFVNGMQVGSEPVELRVGDLITLGATRIRVVCEGEKSAPPAEPSVGSVDLGLGSSAPSGTDAALIPTTGSAALPKRRSPFITILWVFAVVVLGVAAWLFFETPSLTTPAASSAGGTDVQSLGEEDQIVEMFYEKVSADSTGIFRFALSLGADGTLKVSIDDVPVANRHIVKSARLNAGALARMREILTDGEFLSLDREFAGPNEEPPKLESFVVKVVYSGRVKSVRVVNTPEPDAFRRMRERLEAFTKNELGIWAIQYSTDKLIELSEASARTAQTKWEDRDVEYGNLHAAISAWREAMFYLETVNPKPAEFETYRTQKERAEAELSPRYSDQRFRADKAINLGDWATAAAELKVLCELVPDRDDERYRETAAKLVDVEKRLKKGAAR